MNKLIVTALSCIASLALAAVTPAQAANDHYKCFKLKDAKTFKKATADIDVVGGHLSGLQNCQISAGAKEYCVPVTKSGVVVEDGTETPVSGQAQNYDRLCYKLKCPASEPGPQAYMDQFGTRTIDGFKIATICTPAIIGPPPTEPPPTWPADAHDYDAGPTSYVNTLTIPGIVSGVPTCCKDFGSISRDKIENNTNNIDNGLAQLADTLNGLGIDLQQALTDAIMDGSLVLLLDHQALDFLSLPDQFALVQLLGTFAGVTDYTLANSGAGTFHANLSSFVPGSGEPLNWYHPATMDASQVTAGPFTFSLSLPFGFLSLNVSAEATVVEAIHGTVTPAGVPYSAGELSGYIPMSDIFENLNDILNSATCACLGSHPDVYHQAIDGSWSSTGTCISTADSLCTLPAEEVCVTLADSDLFGSPPQVCGILPTILQNQADIDLNSNSDVYEAMSVGLEFTGV
jgi:hypothetical protein